MVADENSIPLVKQTFKSGSHKGRYFYQQGRSSLFSLFYTCRYFTGVIACLINQGKNVKRIKWLKLQLIGTGESACVAPCVVLVINDNPYGLMFALR